MKTKETNDLGYPEINAKDLIPLGDQLLVSWEYNQEIIKLGNFFLSRPDNYRKMHYCGTVLAIGSDVNKEVTVGCRVAFDQFSDPDKFWDQELGRIALIKESKQAALFMVISPRTIFTGGENEYNYEV